MIITPKALALFLLAGSPVLSQEMPVEDVEVRLDPKTPYFELSSHLSVGDHGEQELDVSYQGAACGTQWRFHHATIDVVRNRFGEVQFVGLPAAGCIRCEPVRIRWMHEPTGYLEFTVNVFRRRYHVACDDVTPSAATEHMTD